MSLRTKLQDKQFVVTVELDPPKSSNANETLQQASRLHGYVDAVNIADCPMAKMRMSPIALSCIIQQQAWIETIFHLTCRDRNTIGLQSELLGASALGIHNILTLTGDDPSRGDHPDAKAVFEVDSSGLLTMANTLNQGKDMMGNELEQPTHFFIGTTANPGADDVPAEVARLAGKIEKGANFVQTQPIYDLEKAARFLEQAAPLGIPIILGLIPLKSYKMARYLHEKVPGISLSEETLARMEKGGKEEGVRIAQELLVGIRDIAAGVHIMPLNDMDVTISLVKSLHA